VWLSLRVAYGNPHPLSHDNTSFPLFIRPRFIILAESRFDHPAGRSRWPEGVPGARMPRRWARRHGELSHALRTRSVGVRRGVLRRTYARWPALPVADEEGICRRAPMRMRATLPDDHLGPRHVGTPAGFQKRKSLLDSDLKYLILLTFHCGCRSSSLRDSAARSPDPLCVDRGLRRR
jgi:hypothetical protein